MTPECAARYLLACACTVARGGARRRSAPPSRAAPTFMSGSTSETPSNTSSSITAGRHTQSPAAIVQTSQRSRCLTGDGRAPHRNHVARRWAPHAGGCFRQYKWRRYGGRRKVLRGGQRAGNLGLDARCACPVCQCQCPRRLAAHAEHHPLRSGGRRAPSSPT